MRRSMAVPAVAGLLALAGCGTGDDRDQARTVAERFYRAVERQDGREACEQLSASAVSQLEGQSGQRCREVVTRLELEPARIVHTEVFVTNARVETADGESAFLDREPTGWKLTAIGCKPEDGKPRDRPMDCEVEA